MKIKATLLVISIIVVGLYIYVDQTWEKTSIISADHAIFETYNDALRSSDVVLEVTASTQSKNVNNGDSTGFTVSKVKINQVFENKHTEQPDILLKEGELISVLEPTFTVSNGMAPGVTRFNYADYTKMKPQATYVLFLKWDDRRKAYWVNSLEQGKFSVGNADKKELIVTILVIV